MRTYKNLFNQITDRENIRKAILNASKRKRNRKDVIEVLNNIDYHVERVHGILISGRYVPHIDEPCMVNEGTHHKVRTIRKPRFKYDQIIHHCIVQVLQPIFTKPMYTYSCGSIPGRGSHYGKRQIERWLKHDIRNTKYVFKMDIKHFYDSIDKEILKEMIGRKIKDDDALDLIYKVIDSCEKGLPLGNYTSQWFANFMLTPLDHYIKERLHAKYYMRYMDDIVIFGCNKKQLHRMHKSIEIYLRDRLHLRIKDNWQVFRFEYKDKGRPLDFMGFKFYRNKTILRKSIFIRILRKARQLIKRVTIKGAYAMISYMGYIRHTDTYLIYAKYIKPYINIGKLKKFVGKRVKTSAERRNNYAKLEECNRHTGGTSGRAGTDRYNCLSEAEHRINIAS